MCESTVYITKDGRMESRFEHLDGLEVNGDSVVMIDMFGESKKILGKVRKFSLVEHSVIVEASARQPDIDR